MDVVRALGELGDTRSRPALRARAEVDLDARVRRRIKETLRDLAGDRRPHQRLDDDLQKLQGEHCELKARVAALEARLGVSGGEEGAAKAKPRAGTPTARRAPKAGKKPPPKSTARAGRATPKAKKRR
jgi:aminopeptidase N